MAQLTPEQLPAGVSLLAIRSLLEDYRQREQLLFASVGRFEARYGQSLSELEARLARGEGQESASLAGITRGIIPKSIAVLITRILGMEALHHPI